ncbi:hypothetical protein ACFQY4_02410 [Catellatospora bangladeshensis]|uniref:Uncharacterized protein n=1 Tax=Catellatospora bangladeshensis TaxID=310355 RepID=A0A8J3J7F3_9ACTN|nr:hypothetical protein [Catellatospora bangladeshensis]GIF79517.1 hypothetical protein Cba03nite_08660 [Catellatospora bangladeshensis]
MTPKRGDRVAPPSLPGEYALRFATNDAVKGWDELCRQAAANTRAAFEALRGNPCPRPETDRQHRLRHDLAWGTHDGRSLEQWQYEVTSGGRIWYLVDHDTRTCWIKHAGTGHPKATDR